MATADNGCKLHTMRTHLLAILLLEVMDKELSAPGVWLSFLIPGLIGFLLGRRTWWAAIPFVGWNALGAQVQMSELHDPHVGQSIMSEVGRSYFVHSYAAMLISIVLPFAGMLIGWNRRKQQRN
jgi:hypothetical protein